MAEFARLPPLGLYVHFPWCERKCPYCDFNSHEHQGPLPEMDYVQALLKDLEQDLPFVWGRRISSLFIGGGTPSLLTPAALDILLAGLRARLPMTSRIEITVEANPGTVDRVKLKAYRDLGINRLSLGVQSFHDEFLTRLGRIHSAAQAQQAIDAAISVGFDNINIDLMYGLPGQSVAQAVADVQIAVTSGAQHISYYQLTIEPNTYFAHHPPILPHDHTLESVEHQGLSVLQQAGYGRYEISAFALAGFECQHNCNYWEFGDYLGIGAGAHAKLSQQQQVFRYEKIKNPKTYMEKIAAGQSVRRERGLNSEDLSLEFMMNALRLKHGFSPQLFCERTGLDVKTLQHLIKKPLSLGLLEQGEARIAATTKGYGLLNSVLQEFLIA